MTFPKHVLNSCTVVLHKYDIIRYMLGLYGDNGKWKLLFKGLGFRAYELGLLKHFNPERPHWILVLSQ